MQITFHHVFTDSYQHRMCNAIIYSVAAILQHKNFLSHGHRNKAAYFVQCITKHDFRTLIYKVL